VFVEEDGFVFGAKASTEPESTEIAAVRNSRKFASGDVFTVSLTVR